MTKRSFFSPDQRATSDPALVIAHDYSNPAYQNRTQIQKTATLVVAPFALHDAGLADLAPHYSLMDTLQSNGIDRMSLIEWVSATPETAHHSISTQLALLDRMVDHHGGRTNLIGLCQGGWLSLIYAALFPNKIRRLVLVGAPVDFHANLPVALRRAQELSQSLSGLGLADFGFTRACDFWTGQWATWTRQIVRGGDIRWLWPYDLERDRNIAEALQIPNTHPPKIRAQAIKALKNWDQRLLDLPAPYFWQVVHWLYRDNRLAQGTLYALDQRVDLRAVTCPIYLLAGETDHIVSLDQISATIGLVGTPPEAITMARAPCGHLALFMGHQTLTRFWPPIAQWLREDEDRHKTDRKPNNSN